MDLRGTGRSALLDCKGMQSYTGDTATLTSSSSSRPAATSSTTPTGGPTAASSTPPTSSARPTTRATWPRSSAGCSSGRSTSTATPTAPTSRSPSSPSSRSCCARWSLDSAYEARDLDPWYVTTVTTARTAFEAACTRALACDQAAGTGAWQRIGQLADGAAGPPDHGPGARHRRDARADDRRHPAARRPGQRRRLRLRRLPIARRRRPGLPRAPRRHSPAAAVGRGLRLRRRRLLRAGQGLLGRRRSSRSAAPTTRSCSTCRRHPPQRRQQLAASIKALPANTFAPFTTAEWIQMNQFTEAYTACLDWPAPTHPADPAVQPGRLDGRDRRAGPGPQRRHRLAHAGRRVAQHVARQIGPAARSIVVPNMVHLVALYDRYGCGVVDLPRVPAAAGRAATPRHLLHGNGSRGAHPRLVRRPPSRR